MKLKDVIKANQPDVFKEMAPKKPRKRKRRRKKCKLREVRIDDQLARELMGHDAYTRGRGGAVKQVRHT